MKPAFPRILLASMALTMVLSTPPVGADSDGNKYKAIEITDGGRIVGTVKWEGDLPKRQRMKVTGMDRECHKRPIPDESLIVSKDREVRWAVISISEIDEGKPFPDTTKSASGKTPEESKTTDEGATTDVSRGSSEPDQPIVEAPKLNQKGCRFFPHVVVVPQNQDLLILNPDGIMHNVHTYSMFNAPQNTSMPGAVTELKLTFKYPEEIGVKCDIHAWMGAWIVVAEHPYYAVSDRDGAFTLDDVPPGQYTLRLWHETLGEFEQEITVESGQDSVVEFTLRQ